jgi:hypothetical protein
VALKLGFRVRDRHHNLIDRALVVKGPRGLLVGDKVFFDMTATDLPDGARGGTEFEDVEFDDLWFKAYYDGRLELSFTGGAVSEQKGDHWVVGRHGLDKLQHSKGWTTVFLLHSGVSGRPPGNIKIEGGVVNRPDLRVEFVPYGAD